MLQSSMRKMVDGLQNICRIIRMQKELGAWGHMLT